MATQVLERPLDHRQAPRDIGRLPALDGVRGLAALVVVTYHASLIARPFVDGELSRAVWAAATESPLKLPFAGTEAVQVFFVLSGLVVTLPALREGFSWSGYYVSRLLRLYLPVWAAIALSMGLIALLPRDPSKVTADSWMTEANLLTPDWAVAVHDATLTSRSYDTVNVLWSLRWELMFSIVLPVFVVVALALRRHVWIAAGACVAAMVAGRVFNDDGGGLDALIYLPTFLLGCLIAVCLPELLAWARARRRTTLWRWLAVISALVLIASWWGRSFAPYGTVGYKALLGLAGAGAAGLIVVALCSPTAERLLQWRPAASLGALSFSLYLVHVPILVTLAFWWGDAAWPLVAAVGIPLSLGAAWVFWRVVERPLHRLARAAGRRAQKLLPAGSMGA
ncbi:MAG: acyltransferase [Microbacterium sp.]